MYFALTIQTPKGARSLATVNIPECTADEAAAIQTHMRLPSVAPASGSRLCFGLGLAYGPTANSVPPLAFLGPNGRVRSHSKHAALADPHVLADALQTAINGFRNMLGAMRAEGARRENQARAAQAATAAAVDGANLATVNSRARTIAAELRRADWTGAEHATRQCAEWADRIERIGEPDGPNEYWGAVLSVAQYSEISGHVQGQQKINAIKALRFAVPRFGLKEAKDWIEGHWVDLGGKLGPHGEHWGANGDTYRPRY